MEFSQNLEEGDEALVFSGKDECEIIKTQGISNKISEIIENAEEYCFLVSPYLKIWKHLDTSFKMAVDKKIRIIFFLRENPSIYKNKNKEKIKNILNFNKDYNFDIIFIKNLHAKIYLNEKEALITSMNLYDVSVYNNLEIGILIHNKDIIKNIASNIILDWIYTGRNDKLTQKGNYYQLLEDKLIFEKTRHCVHCGKYFKYIEEKIYYCEPCQEKFQSQKLTPKNCNYCTICGEVNNNKKQSHYTCYKEEEKKKKENKKEPLNIIFK